MEELFSPRALAHLWDAQPKLKLQESYNQTDGMRKTQLRNRRKKMGKIGKDQKGPIQVSHP